MDGSQANNLVEGGLQFKGASGNESESLGESSGLEFLSRCLLLDLEAKAGRIHRIGAVWGGKTLERKGRFDLGSALQALDEFGDKAEYVLGHNLLGHDIPILYGLSPNLRLLSKPVVDTLFLSPLAFPENPYHRLVKDYKLVRESLNDPAADARLAASVFMDQWKSFTAVIRAGNAGRLSFYHHCFRSFSMGQGLSAVFEALGCGGETPFTGSHGPRNMAAAVASLVGDRVCNGALRELPGVLTNHAAGWELPALAYAVAWLLVAGGDSVLPPWVRHRFPEVREVLHRLRDKPCMDPRCAYCKTVHDPVLQLDRYFGFKEFRAHPVGPETGGGLQEAIVRRGMGDQPLLAILPTGGGKSLCYQLPALVRHFRRGALSIVITPLQALMKDQVDNLAARTGAPSAAALNGLLTPPERNDVLQRVRLGDIALLYVAPEQLRNKSFRKTISQREIGCWIFDEAHCLSKWGHDFRPDYLYAGRFIREFSAEQKSPVPAVVCFTATAKKEVKEEILDFFWRELGQRLEVFEGSVERQNLRFEVQMVGRAEKFERIHTLLTERLPESSGSAVVYSATRRGAELVAEYLRTQGCEAAAFHAGLTAPEKRAVQEAFIQGRTRIICATNAFGMGIDKEDVRLVMHADIPGSLENYLQEAGRAGRDMKDAECVLLFDAQDVETQFQLEARSELTRRDIAEILRGLRRARRNENGEVVITSGELLRHEDVETSFDMGDRQADTKVKTAVAWLERAGFVERNHNETRVFQGSPLVKDLEEARARMARLNLSEAAQRRWLAIMEEIINAGPNEGLNADELAGLPALRGTRESDEPGMRERGREETETQRVLRDLHGMAEAGLLQKGLLFTAFVRHKVQSPSRRIFDRVCSLEEAMLKRMQEAAPDAAEEGWQDLSLRSLNQRLVDEGYTDCNPEVLRGLLRSLKMDGRGLAGARGSLDLQLVRQDHYRVKLQRNWDALLETARRRRAVAGVVLQTILGKISQETQPSGELLVSFSSDDLTLGLRSNIYLAGQIKDPLGAVERGLMFLHEQRVIILQQGFGVFRQAMSIRLGAHQKHRRYKKADFEPLQGHYKERVLQIHVMNEYARLGMEKIRQALELVLAYFSLDKASFLRRYFPGRREVLERATSQESYRRIVEELHNPAQAEIVTAPEDENMLVLAGPGSGKTRVVVHRCAYLLRVKRVPPSSILVLCFNRNASISLRRRLHDLVGRDSRGVAVLTYHGLAMRLTGTSLVDLGEKRRGMTLDFDSLITEATGLLRGERGVIGLQPDELRDRLLAGYGHILVDEYQDVDQPQYDLIAALAGRYEQDPDRKLTILAVGDDDQNIYSFRGANVQFLRRFQEDYGAKVRSLVENYRSTAHVIAAANQIIGHNLDRMKSRNEIRVDRSREGEFSGGLWERLDQVGRGRVQVLQVKDESEQVLALVAELERMRRVDPQLRWSDCAVLGRTRQMLASLRVACEQRGIPVAWGVSRDKAPPLHRIREIAAFLQRLKVRRKEILRASHLLEELMAIAVNGEGNPWWSLLQQWLSAWSDETADAELPVSHAIDNLYEALMEQRYEPFLGQGVLLCTVHAAKGMEFSHVFIPSGDWSRGRNKEEREEERRVFYVAMTRARETLCLLDRRDADHPHVGLLDGDFLIRRTGASPTGLPGMGGFSGGDEPAGIRSCGLHEMPGSSASQSGYELLGMRDLHLDFAARFPPEDPIHRHLARLHPGSSLKAKAHGGRVGLVDRHDLEVARLSRSASSVWLSRMPRIESVRILGMIQRTQDDLGDEYKGLCRSPSWEVPWVEVIYRERGCSFTTCKEV